MGRAYEVFGWLVELLVVRSRRDRSKDVEFLVLAQGGSKCCRQVSHPWFRTRDRMVLTALRRVMARRRWASALW